MSRDVDRKIRKVLVRENKALSSEAREAALDTFRRNANAATHKSKLHLRENLRRWAVGAPIGIFPHYDEERASAYNILFFATWSLISTLPYLGFALPGQGLVWLSTYEKVQLAFREGPARGPKKATPSVPRGNRRYLRLAPRPS